MKNLEITLELASPIELPPYPIHLDGLLYWSLDGDLAKLESVLAKEQDIYKASSLCFIRSANEPVTATMAEHPSRTHWSDWNYPVVGKKSIITKGGPYRKRMTKRNAINAAFVQFHAVGHAEKIEYLLDRLGFIGLSNNQGFGEISKISINEIEHDYSFFDENGELARILPTSRIESPDNYLIQTIRYKPSYTNSELCECAVPNFRLKTI